MPAFLNIQGYLEIGKWSVSFAWIKAHVGIYGNDVADRTVKAAASDQNATVR